MSTAAAVIAEPSAPSRLCELCGVSLALRYAEVADTLTGDRYQIDACPRCAHGHTWPTAIDFERAYGPQYHGRRHGVTGNHCARRRLGFVAACLGGGADRRLLDVGCGDGTFLLACQQAGWQVSGTEMNPSLARQAGLDVHGSLAELPADASFDCITLWHVLEHLPDPLAELQRLRGLLAPQGRLLVAVPNARSPQARLWGADWLHLDVPRHLHHFSHRSLEQHLARAGLTIERSWRGEIEYDVFGWLQSALNHLLPERNVLFSLLTGRGQERGRLSRWGHLLLGALCGAPALALAFGERLANRPGTLVVSALPQSASR